MTSWKPKELTRGADLGQEQGQGLQQGRLHRPGKAVSQDTDERSSDVDHRRPQRLGGGQLDDSAQGFSRLLLLLRAAGEDPLPEDGQDTRHPLGKKTRRQVGLLWQQPRLVRQEVNSVKTAVHFQNKLFFSITSVIHFN